MKADAAERRANVQNDDDIHAGFEIRFPTHTFTDEEVAKIKAMAEERQNLPPDNDDDIHAGFEMRFPTHTFTAEEVAKIKEYAAERRANIVNDDDIHAGLEFRFPTHTYTDDEIHQMKVERAQKDTEDALKQYFPEEK